MPIKYLVDESRDVLPVPYFRDQTVLYHSIPAFDLTGGPAITEGATIGSDKLRVRGGDVLVSKLNPRKSRVQVVTERRGTLALSSTEFVVLRPRRITASYLAYLLRSQPVRQGLAAAVRSVTRSQQRVEAEDVLRVTVPLNDPGRQRDVAVALDLESLRLAVLSEKIHRLLRLAHEYEQALINDIASRLATVRLGLRATVQTGLTLGHDYRGQEVVEYPYLRVANVQADRIVLNDLATVAVPPAVADRVTLLRGDVLMTEGGDIDKLGRGAVWDGSIDPCLHQNHVFAVRCNARLVPEMLALWTRSAVARSYFERTASRITNIASTNRTKLRALPVPDAPISDQRSALHRFEQARRPIVTLRERARQLSSRLAEYRDALITEAVTGQLDVTRLSDSQLDESAHAAMEGDRPEVLTA